MSIFFRLRAQNVEASFLAVMFVSLSCSSFISILLSVSGLYLSSIVFSFLLYHLFPISLPF
jgi:hypothetical protein